MKKVLDTLRIGIKLGLHNKNKGGYMKEIKIYTDKKRGRKKLKDPITNEGFNISTHCNRQMKSIFFKLKQVLFNPPSSQVVRRSIMFALENKEKFIEFWKQSNK